MPISKRAYNLTNPDVIQAESACAVLCRSELIIARHIIRPYVPNESPLPPLVP